jgi:thiol-disulfide isomerase/thioredoxin
MNRALALCAGMLLTASLRAEVSLTPVTAADLDERLEAIASESDDVVLLNFWATWCRPCLDEIPVFMELEQRYADEGFRLVAVSLDDAESIDNHVLPFMRKWFPDFASLISVEYEMDDMVSVVDNGWNEVLPTSYLFARDGSLAERLQGSFTAAEFAARIEAELER